MIKGSHQSPEEKQKHSEWMSGRYIGEKNSMWGKHHSDETKKKMRARKLGKPISEEHKQKIMKNFVDEYGIRLNLGKPNPNKNKTYVEMFGTERAEKIKQKHSVVSKKLWQNEEYAKDMRAGLRPSGPELYIDFLLQNYFPDEWWFVGDGEITISGLCPDFINVNGKKLIIELFGDYWHTRKGIGHRYTEEGRKEVFAKPGYSTLIIWEHELADESKVIEKIRCFNES